MLMNEIRYAERLCQRTARLYRRLQAAGTFVAVVAGSAALAALSKQVEPWISICGGAVFAAVGALMLAVRPADKAAANEADVKRYAKLKSDGATMDEQTLRLALLKARESDAPEIEPLRDVAYNDVANEVGSANAAVALRWHQRLLAALA